MSEGKYVCLGLVSTRSNKNPGFEVYLSTPIEECERCDVKGLYKKARAEKISNFTGISSSYEPSDNTEIVIDTSAVLIREAADNVVMNIRKYI